MSGYIWMLLWLLIYTALSVVLEVQQSETVCGVQTVRFTKLWATLGVLPLLIFCTLRGDIGDTYNYMHAFSEMPSTFSALPDYIQSLQKDHGFFLLSALIKLLCGGQVRVWFCILAALQLWPLVKNYRLYSESYCISLFLFIASTDYISWMMNGMRQFLAAALVFACCPLLLRKRYGQATLIILLAATLHASALFALFFSHAEKHGTEKRFCFFCSLFWLCFSSTASQTLWSCFCRKRSTKMSSAIGKALRTTVQTCCAYWSTLCRRCFL